jgi:hypothetical protein
MSRPVFRAGILMELLRLRDKRASLTQALGIVAPLTLRRLRLRPALKGSSWHHSLTALRAPMVAGYPGSPPERSPLASLLRSSCRQ